MMVRQRPIVINAVLTLGLGQETHLMLKALNNKAWTSRGAVPEAVLNYSGGHLKVTDRNHILLPRGPCAEG